MRTTTARAGAKDLGQVFDCRRHQRIDLAGIVEGIQRDHATSLGHPARRR